MPGGNNQINKILKQKLFYRVDPHFAKIKRSKEGNLRINISLFPNQTTNLA